MFSDDILRSLLLFRGTWRTFRGIPWNMRTHSPFEIVKYHSNLVNCTMGDWTHYANVLRSNYTVITRRDKPLTSCFQNLRYWHYSCVNLKTQTHNIWGMFSNRNWYRAKFGIRIRQKVKRFNKTDMTFNITVEHSTIPIGIKISFLISSVLI